jgi:hypothetical protein
MDASKSANNNENDSQEAVGQTLLSPEEMQKQDAEKLLRSIDDKVGRYLVPNVSPEQMRRSNEKSW